MSDKKQLSVGEILNRPAEEFGNDLNIEIAWMSSAIRHMEAYYKLITSVNATDVIKLTPIDDEVYEQFRKEFPDLKVDALTEEMIKSDQAKIKWRNFCTNLKDKVEDYNFATLMRLNSQSDYSEDNTIVVPRAQFLAIEIARNREGLNVNLPPFHLD